MKPPTTSISELTVLNPCASGIAIASTVMPAEPFSAAQARAAGVSYDDILWGISAIALMDPDFNRRLQAWLDDCHTHAIELAGDEFSESQRQSDLFARRRDFADKRLDAGVNAAVRAAARASWAAAKRSAGVTARMSMSVMGVMPMNERGGAKSFVTDQVGVNFRATRDAFRARERTWQFDRLVAWFSDPEPDPLTRL